MIQPKESFSGPLPKWIEAKSTNDFIAYATSTMTTLTDVMLIYNKSNPEIKELCSKMNWKYVYAWEINGSESSVIIILDLYQWNEELIHYEALTRAKHELIIVTESVKSKLFQALKQIENESHNDIQCQEYENKHKKNYGTLPTPCPFKNNPDQISKLLEKITLPNIHSLT